MKPTHRERLTARCAITCRQVPFLMAPVGHLVPMTNVSLIFAINIIRSSGIHSFRRDFRRGRCVATYDFREIGPSFCVLSPSL